MFFVFFLFFLDYYFLFSLFPHFFFVYLRFFSFLKASSHSGRSKVTRTTVGRDTNQSLGVCEVNLADPEGRNQRLPVKGCQNHKQRAVVAAGLATTDDPWPSLLRLPEEPGVQGYIGKFTQHCVGQEVLNNTVNCLHRLRRGSLYHQVLCVQVVLFLEVRSGPTP